MTNKTVLSEALPTENMIVAGMEAIGMLNMTEEYQQLTGCQQGAETAGVCWAAMVSHMKNGEPSQDKAPSDNEILAAWREAHWATYDSDPKGVVKFARLLFKRYEQAVLQSPEIQQLRAKAARYDWLRSLDQIREHDDWQIYDGYGNTPRGSDLDDAIDAAMETKQP